MVIEHCHNWPPLQLVLILLTANPEEVQLVQYTTIELAVQSYFDISHLLSYQLGVCTIGIAWTFKG